MIELTDDDDVGVTSRALVGCALMAALGLCLPALGIINTVWNPGASEPPAW